MLGTLLESRANKQRRGGGAAASVIVHSMVITGAVVGTAAGKTAVNKIDPPRVVIIQPPPATNVEKPAPASNSVQPLPPNMVVREVDIPTTVPTTIPTIQMPSGPPADSIVIGHPGTRGTGGPPGSIIDGEGRNGTSEWTVNDIMMNVLTPAKPRYPESLRSAGIDGLVLVEFVVDTTGRVDMNSVKIVSSTHDLFSRSVREALGNFRFRPAESGGHRIPALAQMPFQFQIK
jgi:protein TonB